MAKPYRSHTRHVARTGRTPEAGFGPYFIALFALMFLGLLLS